MKKKIIKIIGLIIVLLCLGFLGFIGKASFDGLTNIASREETKKNMNSYRDKYESFAKGKSIEEIKIKRRIQFLYGQEESVQHFCQLFLFW